MTKKNSSKKNRTTKKTNTGNPSIVNKQQDVIITKKSISLSETSTDNATKQPSQASPEKKDINAKGVNTDGMSKARNGKPENSTKTQPAPGFKSPKIRIDAKTQNRIFAVVLGAAFIGLTIWVSFFWIISVVNQTDDAKIAIERKEQEQKAREEEEAAVRRQVELEEQFERENDVLSFQNQTVTIKTNFGDLIIDLEDETAPQTVENFLRLVYRDYYDGLRFFRMATAEDFYILQGGDPLNNGSGGESARGGTIEDELWEIEPEYNEEDGSLLNQPTFRQPPLVKEFNAENGTALYEKGIIAMAKTAQPDSGGSQFFLILDNSRMPAEYTAFGKVQADSFTVLERILSEVSPNSGNDGDEYRDGEPNQEIKIESVVINGLEE